MPLSDDDLAAIRAIIRAEIERYAIKRKPPSDITEKRRAAARAMLAKRAERALAEQMLKPKKVNGHAARRANAEQMLIGDGEIVCSFPSLRGEVEIRRTFVSELIEAYPGCMVAMEIDRARLWCEANPSKRKSNVRRFLTTWMARCQERGGSK